LSNSTEIEYARFVFVIRSNLTFVIELESW